MARIKVPDDHKSSREVRAVLDTVYNRLGFVPNMHKVMSLSPAALTGWAGLLGALSKTLDVKTRDAIGLAVSEVSSCNYCLSAHSYMASTFSKISPEEIAANRKGQSSDPKRNAAVGFSQSLIKNRGKVSDADFKAVRLAGYSDQEIIEIIALSAQFLLTNFINNAVETSNDFPIVHPAGSNNR